MEVPRPKQPVVPDEVIIPPPPSFSTEVSCVVDEPLPIIVVPERILLPEPAEAETTMQSTDTTNSPESEIPPPVNYSAHPILASLRQDNVPPSVISLTLPQQVFRQTDSLSSDDYYRELSVSPGKEPEPPELLHAQYGTLPSVSHVPNSPCNLHPDETYIPDIDYYVPSYKYYEEDHENVFRNPSPNMVHSATYPLINPYPCLTTVAGTYNPYTCDHIVCANSQGNVSQRPQTPTLVTPVVKDVYVSRSVVENDDVPKSVQTERRVHFGEVSAASESDDHSAMEGRTSPVSVLKPAWSSKIKAFAIGEVMINECHLTRTRIRFF